MENLTGGTPPVRYLPCVVPCKLYFIVVNTTYSITIRIVDGSGTRTLYRTASLEYTDEILAAQGWGAGTYSSRTESLQKHFDKHHNDSGVNVNNIVAYLALAVATFNDTLNNPNDYRIVQQSGQTGFEAAHKYTHRTNHRFIIYGDNTELHLTRAQTAYRI